MGCERAQVGLRTGPRALRVVGAWDPEVSVVYRDHPRQLLDVLVENSGSEDRSLSTTVGAAGMAET